MPWRRVTGIDRFVQDRRRPGPQLMPLLPSTASPVRTVPYGGAHTTRRTDVADEWGGGFRSPGLRRATDRPRPGGGAARRRSPGRCRPDQVRGGRPRPGAGDGGRRRAARRRDPPEQPDRHPQGERCTRGSDGDPLSGPDRGNRVEPGRLRVHGDLRLPGTSLLRRRSGIREPAGGLDPVPPIRARQWVTVRSTGTAFALRVSIWLFRRIPATSSTPATAITSTRPRTAATYLIRAASTWTPAPRSAPTRSGSVGCSSEPGAPESSTPLICDIRSSRRMRTAIGDGADR